MCPGSWQPAVVEVSKQVQEVVVVKAFEVIFERRGCTVDLVPPRGVVVSMRSVDVLSHLALREPDASHAIDMVDLILRFRFKWWRWR